MTRLKLSTAICLSAAALLIHGCGEESRPAPRPTGNTWELPVASVVEMPLPVAWDAVGTVVSEARVDVTSRVTGYIRTLHVREGDTVKAGQLLVSLDGNDIEGAVRQAQSAVDTSAALLADAQADLRRYQNLFDAGSIAEVQLRKARLQRDTLEEQLKGARAALTTAMGQRGYVDIVSPTDGVIVARYRQTGDLAAPGIPILTVESSALLMFATYVTDAHLAKIDIGDPVDVKLESLSVTGKVARVVPSSDPVTRKFEVKIALPANAAIRPGVFGRAQFLLGGQARPVIQPSWLVERGGLKGVFVLDPEQRAHFRWIRTRREWPDKIEVVAGLRAGETVVAKRDPRLREGDLVRPLQAPPDEGAGPEPATTAPADMSVTSPGEPAGAAP